jgi:hypothetical protein
MQKVIHELKIYGILRLFTKENPLPPKNRFPKLSRNSARFIHTEKQNPKGETGMSKNTGIITGTWSSVKLVCAHRHKEPVVMELRQGPSSLFYACPKYYPENRDEGERACNNRLNLVDYERMLAHINALLYEAEFMGEKPNLTNHKWKDAKGTEYKILLHEKEEFVVEMFNKRAINT